MTLEQMILKELKKIDLDGISVVRVISKPEITKIIFNISSIVVEFVVNDIYQYQILKATYHDKVYENADALNQFNQIVSKVIKEVKPIEMFKRAEFIKKSRSLYIPSAKLLELKPVKPPASETPEIKQYLQEEAYTELKEVTQEVASNPKTSQEVASNVKSFQEEVASNPKTTPDEVFEPLKQPSESSPEQYHEKVAHKIKIQQSIKKSYQKLLNKFEDTNSDIKMWELGLHEINEDIPEELIEIRDLMLGMEQEVKSKLGVVSYRNQKIAIDKSLKDKYQRLLKECKQAKKELDELREDLYRKIPDKLDDAESFFVEVEQIAQQQLGKDVKNSYKMRKTLSLMGYTFFFTILFVSILGMYFFSETDTGQPREFLGYTPLTVSTSSMQQDIPQGSFIIARKVDPNTIRIGDDITYVGENGRVFTQRVVEIINNYRDSLGFQTQGLENVTPDEEIIIPPNIIGRVIFVNLLIGQIIQFVQQPIIFIILLIVLLGCSIGMISCYSRAHRAHQQRPTAI